MIEQIRCIAISLVIAISIAWIITRDKKFRAWCLSS